MAQKNSGKQNQEKIQLKFYKKNAVLTLLYGSENKLRSVEIKLLRAVKGRTRRDHSRNEAVPEELGVTSILTHTIITGRDCLCTTANEKQHASESSVSL